MESQNDKTMAILAYIIFFIPLLAVKNRSQFLNFHINQGLILFIVAIVGSVALSFIPVSFIYTIWNLLIFILAIIGIINASKNEMTSLPVIGGLFRII